MPVFSYLAYPEIGAKNKLMDELQALEHCEAMPADNEEVIILITDTPDDKIEAVLQKKLKGLKSLQSISMTFGHGNIEKT